MRSPLIIAVLAATIVAGCGGSTQTITQTQPAKSPGDLQAERAKNEPAPPPKHEPENSNGKADLSCEYVLGDFGDSGDPSKGYRFIAGGTLENVGNVGIVVKVVYKWKQVGSQPVRVEKTYRVRRGETRDVNVTVNVTQDQIDLIQAVGSSGKDCTTSTTIVDTFGETPLEPS